MDHTTMLTYVLKLHFGWHLARIKCLSCLIIALFKVKTVNCVELATAFSGSATVDSHYRRIQRFFKEVKTYISPKFGGKWEIALSFGDE